MDEETLNEILQDNVKPETTFLSELNNNDENDSTKESTINEGKYHCKYSDGYSTDSLPSLMSHYRSSHPEHKGIHKLKKENKSKEEINNTNEGIEIMSDESDINNENTLDNVSQSEIVETESAKKPKKKRVESDISQIPSDYDRLSSLLQSFGVPNHKGVVEGMKLYDIRDINILKDLLRNVSTPQGKAEAVIRMWSEIQGINKPTIDSNNSSTTKTTPTDALSLMAKLRDEEIQDSIVSSYQAKLKGKQLENDLIAKRLNGELMENKGSPDISKLIELEMLKYQLMQPKPNPELEIMKLQMMQPKTNPDIDILKSELVKLQLQLTTPKTDPQVEILKQQLELQNKKYDDMQRQISEDAKLKLLSDQHKQEMDLLKQQMNEQAKQTQELIKSIQTSTAPKTEDLFKQQISEIQKQSDAKLQVVLDQLKAVNESKRDEDSRRIIESLKEEIKSVKENAGGQIAQVADSMKDFATNITHAFEKKELNDQHVKETEELKKKISDVEHSKSLTNEQYMLEKTTKIAEEGVKAIGGALDGFGKALQPATQKAAETTGIYERAKVAMDLKTQGFNEQTISSILNQPTQKPLVPSARGEFENLQKMTEQLEKKPIIPITNDINILPEQQLQVEQIKFATENNE